MLPCSVAFLLLFHQRGGVNYCISAAVPSAGRCQLLHFCCCSISGEVSVWYNLIWSMLCFLSSKLYIVSFSIILLVMFFLKTEWDSQVNVLLNFCRCFIINAFLLLLHQFDRIWMNLIRSMVWFVFICFYPIAYGFILLVVFLLRLTSEIKWVSDRLSGHIWAQCEKEWKARGG